MHAGGVTELVRIGYWRNDQHLELPDPSRFVDPTWDTEELELVADYLGGGLPVLYRMGHSPCRMCSLAENGTSELTDGTFLWPEGLRHHVAEHNVRLPLEFVEHAVRRFTELETAAMKPHRDLKKWLRMTD
jgi:hypothetical protein